MRYIVYFFIPFVLYLSISTSCSKPSERPVTNDTIPSNVWQCVIDGESYSGTVDTSFLELVFGNATLDSVIVCTGTSADKKAQIHFKLSLNRTQFPATGINYNFNTYLVFNTAANNLFTGNVNLPSSLKGAINYYLDTIAGKKFAVIFNGNLIDQKNLNHTINGKFSCRLFTGNNEPNKFYCLLDSAKREGYFTSAMLNANTLIMTGVGYLDYPLQLFRISVRTGGTIQPGTYNSSNGDVSFFAIAPSGSVVGPYIIDDTLGNMTITINTVKDNIVAGSFSGVNKKQNKIEEGKFTCRVTNYNPEPIAANRWSFSARIDPGFGVYNCYAGNITNAIKSNVAGRYFLAITGESDNGVSDFKIVVSNDAVIAKGQYQLHYDNSYKLDSIYFRSGVATWDGVVPYLHADPGTAPFGGETYCFIDTIDDIHVVGSFYGIIYDNLEDKIFGSSGPRYIYKASFNAKF